MALNMQIFQQPRKQAIRKNNARYNNNIKKTPRAYTQRKKLKEDLEQSSQSHHNSRFNLKQTSICTIRKHTANRTERCPVQFYKVYHLYLMKIALIKRINKKKDNTTSRHHPSVMKMTYHIKSAEKVPKFRR